MSDKTVTKYLDNYAEKEVGILAGFKEFPVSDYAVAVPMYRESYDFIHRFTQRFHDVSVLLILVVNQPDSDNDLSPQRQLIESIQANNELIQQHHHLSLYRPHKTETTLLLVERFEEALRIPKKYGVGLARKIATDCAVKLIADGQIKNKMIASTDADATLPDDYFECLKRTRSSAAVFDFKHEASGDLQIDKATELYEKRLHYYVEGLKFAGSKYAYHTIGSCLAVHDKAYAQVRGFPKRAGGEDFYLLNKLAKSGDIVQLSSKVFICSRLSSRVPFGTGPAVSDIVRRRQSIADYQVYHPDTFVVLKSLLDFLNNLSLEEKSGTKEKARMDTVCCQYLEESGFYPKLQTWRAQFKSRKQLQKAIHDWFDAFRTLKFVHYCRSNQFTDISLEQALLRLRP